MLSEKGRFSALFPDECGQNSFPDLCVSEIVFVRRCSSFLRIRLENLLLLLHP